VRFHGLCTATGVVDGCRLCLLPPKVHDPERGPAVPDLLCDLSKQQFGRLLQRGHSNATVGWSDLFARAGGFNLFRCLVQTRYNYALVI
jgi:hypothetical protein